MSRISGNYDPTTGEAVSAILRYFNQAVDHAKDPTKPAPDPQLLHVGLPQGSLRAAVIEPDGTITVTIQEERVRFLDPEGFFVFRVLALFEGGAVFIDKNKKGGDELHYVELFGQLGLTAMRVLGDAYPGETWCLAGDHHYVVAANFTVNPGKSMRGRRELHKAALFAYDKNAATWGLADLLSRWEYHMLARGAFRLFDIEHGHEFLEAIGA